MGHTVLEILPVSHPNLCLLHGRWKVFFIVYEIHLHVSFHSIWCLIYIKDIWTIMNVDNFTLNSCFGGMILDFTISQTYILVQFPTISYEFLNSIQEILPTSKGIINNINIFKMCVLMLRIKPWGKKGKCSAIYLCNSIHKIGTEVFCIWDRCKTSFTGWCVVRFQWVHIPFLSAFPFLWGRLRHLWPSLHAELVFTRTGVLLSFYTMQLL